MRSFGVLAIAAALGGGPGAALAQGDRGAAATAAHAIGAIQVGGTASAPLGPALRAAANQGLEAGEVARVAPETVSRLLGAVPELATCVTADCHTRLASAAGAARLVVITVDAKGELYALTIAVVDGRGRALRRRTDECVACAVPELQDRVEAAVRDAVGAATDDRVPVTIDATPAAVALEIDRVGRGPTPWRGELGAGPHALSATDARGASIRQELFVEAAESQSYRVAIPQQRRAWGNLTWAAVGAGGAVVLGGIVFLAIDGDGTCDGPGLCARRYETTAAGVLGLGAGLGLLGAAGWMYWQDHRSERSLTVAPTGDGAGAVYRGRF